MSLRKEPEVFAQAFKLYKSKEYRAALDLLNGFDTDDPLDRRQWFEWRVSMATLMGDLNLAEDIFEDCLDEGFFLSEFSLRKDDDLKPLQNRSRFETLVQRNMQMLETEQQRTKPKLLLIEPPVQAAPLAPLLVALHGNNTNAAIIKEYWQHLSPFGWRLAFPQSSMVSGNGVYVWNDIPRAEEELKAHYPAITKKSAVDPERTVISGFSKGGHAALVAAFKQVFPIRGYIGVAPYFHDVEAVYESLGVLPGSKVRCYFLLGEEDTDCTSHAVEMEKKLSGAGVACGIEIFPGVGHDFPADHEAAIQRALDFIFKE